MKNNFTKEEKEILKNALKDYEDLEKTIKFLKRNIYNIDLEFLKDFVSKLFTYSLCNYQENEYLDFYFNDMLLTISNYGGLGLSDDIEVFFENGSFHFNNKNEIKEVLK